MSKDDPKSGVSRRGLLLAVAGAAPLVALASTQAQAKIPQTAVGYQTEPKDGKQCSTCNFYIESDACKTDAGSDACKTADGSCKTVDGAIKPTGYCKLYNKKPGA